MSGDGHTPTGAAHSSATTRSPVHLARAWRDDTALHALNTWLEGLDASARLAWALANTTGRAVLSTSFGAQSAAALHLVTRQEPDLPVVLVDTGYLFPETYRFADELKARLALNLHVARANESPAWFEARHGQLWAEGLEGIEHYNRLRKVEPMTAMLDAIGATVWIAGLRRTQSGSRHSRQVLERAGARWKLHPIIDWTDRDVGGYLSGNGLPYHPLWSQGYVSIGDTHSTRPVSADVDLEATRFFGLKRECGLHEPAPASITNG